MQHKNGPIRFQAINEGNYVLHIGPFVWGFAETQDLKSKYLPTLVYDT